MRSLKLLLFVGMLPLLFWRCNRDEPIPAYIYIPAVTLTTDSSGVQGTASQKIVDVWVTVGNSYLGAYELPAIIPVLETGSKHVLIRAGVKENGISATRTPYPFYTTFEKDVTLTAKKIDTIKPTFKYDDNKTHFDWIENFESGFMSVEPTSRNTADVGITTKPDSVFEGHGSLHVYMDSTNNFLELNSKTTYVLPRGKAVWLEMNYKTDAPIEIGYLSIDATGAKQVFAAGVNPNKEWNKIYFNLTNRISIEPSANTFRIYILSPKPNDKTSAHILLDNIKLLHFNE
jgi:hypothetical protein